MAATESGGDARQKSFRIQTKEDKFYTRLMSRELTSSSASSPSFRVYYTVSSGAVPFLWESRPGKPKDASSAASLLPPLTPPPSYVQQRLQHPHRSNNAALRIAALLPCLRSGKNPHHPPSSYSLPASPSMSTSTSSHASSPAVVRRGRTRLSSSGSSSSSLGVDEEDPEVASPRSTLCFGGAHHLSAGKDGAKRLWCKMVAAKRKAAGHGSEQHGLGGGLCD